MAYPSYFNVFDNRGEDTRVFSLWTKSVYSFSSRWEDIVAVAGADPKVAAELRESGLFLADRDYLGQIDAYFHRMAEQDKANLVVYFCVTSKCGVGCSYCFQNHLQRRDSTEALIDRFFTLLDRRMREKPRIPVMHLILFGGEPIRRADLCLRLLTGTRRICTRHHVSLRTYLAANGILENRRNLAPLQVAGLHGIQVTFDGPEEVHERTRGHSYRLTLGMLAQYAETFNLAIKYNVTRESGTPENMRRFLDDLVQTGVGPETLIVPEAIVPTLSYDDVSVIFPYHDPALPSILLEFCRLAARRSFRFSLSSAFQPPCFLRRKNLVEIQPDGEVSCCENAPGVQRFVTGHLDTLDTLSPEKPDVLSAMRAAAEKTCAKALCPFFPLCESGCFLVKHVRGTSLNDAECHRQYFEAFFPALFDLLRRRIRGSEPLGTFTS